MWCWNKPTEQEIASFLARQQDRPLSYADIGASQNKSPAGYDIDHNRMQIGKGEKDFRAACDALRRWEMFPRAWTRIAPDNAPIEKGTEVAMLAHAFGFCWMNACRIVYVIHEQSPVRRFGFAYGTLEDHVESGEERFSVEWLDDDSVWYDVRAFSRPRYWVVHIGYPFARRLQKRFVADSQAVMRQAVVRSSIAAADAVAWPS